MGILSNFFSSFSRSGAQVTADIQSVAQRGKVVRKVPTTRPRTRREAIHRARQRVVTTVDKLSRTKQAQFINTQATRIDQSIKRESRARIPSLRDIQMAGYKYGKANPEAARLIYGSGNFGAGVVRKGMPTNIKVSAGKAMYAFSDGAIHGVRNDPVKTLSKMFLKPKSMKPVDIKKRKEDFKKWQKKDLPKWVTDFVGDPLKLSKRDRKIVLPFYGKTSAEALQQKEAMTSYLNYVSKEIKQNPAKIALFLALPPALRTAGKGIQAAGITKLITKVPHGQLITRRTVQLVSAGLGVVYIDNVHKRTIAPIETGKYKDGEISETRKTLPNGDIVIEQEIEQIPITRKPTKQEQIERLSGIFATELLPLSISNKIINRGVKAGYKEPPKAKPKVKTTTKIKRAGKVIKTKAKTKTKEFIKAEKAEAQLILKPKVKPKAKPKAKPKPKVKPINLMKDPKFMAQLNRAKISMSKVNMVASQKRIYQVQQKQQQLAKSKQNQKQIAQKQALINSNIAKQQKQIQKTIKSIELKLAQGKDVKVLQKQLLELKKRALAKQKAEIDALLKQIDEYLIAEGKLSAIEATRALTKIKAKAKQAQTAKQKAVLLSKAKAIIKSLSKQRTLLFAYSKTVQDTKQRQRIIIIAKSIEKLIEKAKTVKKEVQKIILVPSRITKKPPPKPPRKVKEIKKPPPKRPPPKRPPPKRPPPKRPPPKPPVIPAIIPVIPLKPKKPTTKKKKKKKPGEKARAYSIKNPIPTLASFLR